MSTDNREPDPATSKADDILDQGETNAVKEPLVPGAPFALGEAVYVRLSRPPWISRALVMGRAREGRVFVEEQGHVREVAAGLVHRDSPQFRQWRQALVRLREIEERLRAQTEEDGVSIYSGNERFYYEEWPDYAQARAELRARNQLLSAVHPTALPQVPLSASLTDPAASDPITGSLEKEAPAQTLKSASLSNTISGHRTPASTGDERER